METSRAPNHAGLNNCCCFFPPPRQQVKLPLTSWAIPFLLHYHPLPPRPVLRYCSWQKQGVTCASGSTRVGREALASGRPFESWNCISLPSFSFHLLGVADTGLTKFLISRLPWSHSGLLLCLASKGEKVRLLIMLHIMSANYHSESLHFSLFHSFTRVFFVQVRAALSSTQAALLLDFYRLYIHV